MKICGKEHTEYIFTHKDKEKLLKSKEVLSNNIYNIKCNTCGAILGNHYSYNNDIHCFTKNTNLTLNLFDVNINKIKYIKKKYIIEKYCV